MRLYVYKIKTSKVKVQYIHEKHLLKCMYNQSLFLNVWFLPQLYINITQ